MSKPHNDKLAVVTATLDWAGSAACRQSWETRAAYQLPTYVVVSQLDDQPLRWTEEVNTQTTIILRQGGGVVPAFAQGVSEAFHDGAEAVICLHDDVRIDQRDWDVVVQEALDYGVKFGGFGGGTSLGSADLYQTPYDPMQLARGGFVSNLQEAEAHGKRSKTAVRCVCFDGFCQIGTTDWFREAWALLGTSPVVHHFYDGVLGCLAARAGVQPGLMVPVACHHYGGRTAVENVEYQRWAREQRSGGDQTFWEEAHQWGYETFKDVLPLSVEQFR